MMATFYAIHVQRKTGEWQTEFTLWQGNPPEPDKVIEANLHGEKIKARVTTIATNRSKAKGEPAVEVHAEEI
jgi:hypothetical protein